MVQSKTLERWLIPLLVISASLILTLWIGWQLGQGITQGINSLIGAAISLAVAAVIFYRPYLGLALLLATLPITDVLPKLPYVTSLSPVIGAVTIVAYFRQRHKSGLPLLPTQWHASYIWGLLFVIWIFVANPNAALKAGRGVALFTFVQLWILVWLAGELLGGREQHRRLIWFYVIACLISAFVALQEGAIGDTFDTRGGEGGLGGINSSARQFAVAFVLLVYLRSGTKPHHWQAWVTWLGQGLLLLGVAVTGSRTGVLIVAAAVVLLLLSPTSGIRPQRVIVPSIVIFGIYFAVPDTYWESVWNSIFPAVQGGGTDTVAIRYELWETAIRMVVDKPFTGVGINQFVQNVRLYSDPLSSTVRIIGAHSVYFSVLAETGFVGFALFMGLIISSLLHALRAALRSRDKADVNLAYAWFMVLVLLLIGGITKQDQYDKLLWFTLGACVSVQHSLAPTTSSNEEFSVKYGLKLPTSRRQQST